MSDRCHLTWWAVPGCLYAGRLHAWVGSSDLSHRKWHKGDFQLARGLSARDKYLSNFLDRLRCHSNLTSIANFIQWFKEICCLQSIWKLKVFLYFCLSCYVSVCVYTDINSEILSLISSDDAWLLFSCYLLFQWGLLCSEKQLVFLKAVRTMLGSRWSRKRFQFHLCLLSRETGNSEMSVQK